MRHITIVGTLNEYDVEDRYFTIVDQDIPMYVFVVIEQRTELGTDNTVIKVEKKYDLITPIEAVIENIGVHDPRFIDVLTQSADMAAKQMLATQTQQHVHGDKDYV